MFHFSTDRLAGLDAMILKITTSPKVSTLIHSHSFNNDTHGIPKKQKPHRETRTPLADKTSSSNLPPPSLHPTSSMLLHALSTSGEVNLHIPPPSCVSSSPDIPSFRPLPPLPSASTLELPSFLNFPARSSESLPDPPARRSTASLPAPALFYVSPPAASSHCVIIPETKNNKVFEGPQWIPAFHHPNSPYVPWSSPVRRRILPPPSPLSPSPVCPSSLFIRSGAVAPEPWTSSTFSQAPNRSTKERLSGSWKSLKNSIKKSVKTVVSRLGKASMCIGHDMLRTYDDTDTTTTVVQPHLTSDAMRSTLGEAHNSGSRDSLASFVSSDSKTLAVWLAERRATESRVINNTPREMSVEEYELMGSWLDLRQCNGGWACGVQDCDMHTTSGSPCVASERSNRLRMAIPFDSAELLSVSVPRPTAPALAFPTGPFSAPLHFHSLPRLPCQTFDMHSAQEAMPAAAERCVLRSRELGMPGGWTFS